MTSPTPPTVAAVDGALAVARARRADLRDPVQNIDTVAREVADDLLVGQPWPVDAAARLAAVEQRGREQQLADVVVARLLDRRLDTQP